MRTLLCVVLVALLAPHRAFPQNVGDRVVVVTDRAPVQVENKTLGSVDAGTITVVERVQPDGFWVTVQTAHQTVRGWVKRSEVVAYSRALAHFNRELQVHASAQSYKARGTIRLADGEIEKALEDFNQAIRLDSTLSDAYLGRSSCWERKSESERALADINEVIRRDPQFVSAYIARGNWAACHDADHEKPLADFTKAIRLDPQNVHAYSCRANTYRNEGWREGVFGGKRPSLDRAIADYDAAIQIEPGSAYTYYERGSVRALKDDFDKALADFNTAIELKLKDTYVYFERAEVWWMKKDLTKSIADYTKAIEVDPSLAKAFYNRAIAWQKIGNYDRALADYNQAARLDSSLAATGPSWTPAVTHVPAFTQQSLESYLIRLADADPWVREYSGRRLQSDLIQCAVFACWDPFDPEVEKLRTLFQRPATPLISRFIRLTEIPDDTVVITASLALGILGTSAQAATPQLERVILDPARSAAARKMAFWALALVVPETQPVGPILIKLLKSPAGPLIEKSVSELPGPRNAFIKGAYEVPWLLAGGHTKVEIPSLLEIAAGDFPPTVRCAALGLLAGFEFDAASAIPQLRKLLKDPNIFVRHSAADALLQIAPDRKLVPELVRALGLKEQDRQEFEKRANEVLARSEDHRKNLREFRDPATIAAILKFLTTHLDGGIGFYRRSAMQDLRILGPRAKAALPKLRQALADADPETRRMAAEAIREIEPPAANLN